MQGMKILIVEDEDECRRILVLWLRHWGAFDIREAATGQAALDCITRDRPDVMLLDLKLSVLDGWETARRIRASPGALSQLPIIAVTAYIHIWDKAAAMA